MPVPVHESGLISNIAQVLAIHVFPNQVSTMIYMFQFLFIKGYLFVDSREQDFVLNYLDEMQDNGIKCKLSSLARC